MNDRNGESTPVEEPFPGGFGPQNLSPEKLHQTWHLTAILAYQRRVRVLIEQLREREQEMER